MSLAGHHGSTALTFRSHKKHAVAAEREIPVTPKDAERASMRAAVLFLVVSAASALQVGGVQHAARSALPAVRHSAHIAMSEAPVERRGLWGGDKEPPVCC